MRYKSDCRGQKAKLRNRKIDSFRYHWADINNRMYLCGCNGGFRIHGRVKYAISNRYKRTNTDFSRSLKKMV